MSQRLLSRDQFIDELCDFILALPPVEGVNPLAYVLLGQLEMAGVREWMKDFWAFGVTAVQRIAGQLAHTAGDGRTFKAVAQAFSTEAGYYLTPNHMDIWAEFCGEAGISQRELDEYEPIAETLLANVNVDGYFLEYDTERAGGFEPLRFLPKGKKIVVLGLVTSKSGTLEKKDDIKRRIEEATKYAALDQFCLSPQCGFASTEEGNILAEDEEWAKLRMIVELADEVWGRA